MRHWRAIGWGGAAMVLAMPAVAMCFTDEVNWGPLDFVAAAALLGIVGVGIETTARMTRNVRYRLATALALLTGVLLVWVHLAVGIVGDAR